MTSQVMISHTTNYWPKLEFEEHIEQAEDDLRDTEGGEVVIDADYSDAERKQMNSVYVTDNC